MTPALPMSTRSSSFRRVSNWFGFRVRLRNKDISASQSGSASPLPTHCVRRRDLIHVQGCGTLLAHAKASQAQQRAQATHGADALPAGLDQMLFKCDHAIERAC